MKKILIAFLAISTGWFIVSSSARAAELRAGYLFNTNEGERKPIVAYELKEWEKTNIALDLWATDLDDLVNNIGEGDWEGGLAVSYKLPIEKYALRLGYAVGAKAPLSSEAELIHGAVCFAIEGTF